MPFIKKENSFRIEIKRDELTLKQKYLRCYREANREKMNENTRNYRKRKRMRLCKL